MIKNRIKTNHNKTLISVFMILILMEATCLGEAMKVLQRQRLRDIYDNDLDSMEKYQNRRTELEEALADYLQNGQEYMNSDSSSSSSFRERAEAPKPMFTYIGRNAPYGQRSHTINSNDYLEYLNSSPADDSSSLHSSPYKRYNYYKNLGYNSVGLRKRQQYAKVMPNVGRKLEDDDNDYPGMYPGSPYGIYRPRERRVPFYPVTKRSSGPVVKRTDPKVEQELSELFNAKQKTKPIKTTPSEDKSEKKASMTTKKATVKDTTPSPVKQTTEVSMKPNLNKEVNKEQPLQMSKKSVKWSDYFGIDRRKKSTNMDNEWLINRYHKAVEIAKSKKSSEYPLKHFHNHDATSASQEQSKSSNKKSSSQSGSENKSVDSIENLDEKLGGIEESIIDDALKFTGASGAQDDLGGEEMKEIKDSIIARLAIAYNVEKMRKALREYRQMLAMRHTDDGDDSDAYPDNDAFEESGISQEKRVAVPRKQAVDVDRQDEPDADNHIKCTDGDENCAEQNYKVPREFMEQSTFEKGGCERIERACRDVSLILGPYGPIFETACNMHQMCMLCSDNSWFSPTRQCNILFLSKADQLCDGDIGCQRSARESIKYLQHVDRTMRSDLSISCNLECPDKR